MTEAHKKKPLSLNQRLLASSSSSNPAGTFTDKEKQQQYTKTKLEGMGRLFRFSSKVEKLSDEEPNFSGIMDFHTPDSAAGGDKVKNDRLISNQPSFSPTTDFHSPVTNTRSESNNTVEERKDHRFEATPEFHSPQMDLGGDRDSESSGLEFRSKEEKKVRDQELISDSSLSVNEDEADNEDEGDCKDDLELEEDSAESESERDGSPDCPKVTDYPHSDLGDDHDDLGHKDIDDIADKSNEVGAKSETGNGDRRSPSKVTEEKKPQKVKLHGRRRLCKVSTKDEDDNAFAQPSFLAITDFDSPIGKNSVACDQTTFSGVHDLDSPQTSIRDILDDLSSRLETLSVHKRKEDNVETISDSASSVRNKVASIHLGGDSIGNVNWKFDRVGASNGPSDRAPELALNHKAQNAKDEAVGNRNVIPVKVEKKGVDAKKKDYSIGKFGKSVFEDSIVVVSDDEEDSLLVSSNVETTRKPHNNTCHVTEYTNNIFSLDTPSKDSGAGGGEWVFEDGESIILTGKRSNYNLPGKIAKMLYPHQRSGLRWLWSLHCQGTGGILGDDMGLGKTMQMCSFLSGLFHSGLIKRVMVVAPKTLLTHWIKELTAVGLSDKIKEYYGTCAKARQYELQYIFKYSGILLTTYDIVRNNFKALRGDSYFLDEGSEDNIVWDYTILDEGHIIKNPSTQRAKSLLEIPSGHRIIISGTPIQNNLKELWALFSFCCPELLGDKNEFKIKYESAILRGNDKNASDREKRVGSTIAKELRERIKPYFLRRLKSEVFLESEGTNSSKLSKKNEIIVWLRLTQCQKQLYEAFLNSELVLSSFDGSPLAALTVLKKICDHPYLLTKRAAEDVLEGMETMANQDDLGILEKMALHLTSSIDNEDFQNLIDNVSCKIAFILSLLDNLIPEGHKVLIFSQTRKMLNFVQEAIISRGYKFLRIDGTTKISDREKIVNDFQEGEGAPIFLLTSQVGGLGLTLTKADRVIVVDPAWNPSTDNQSVDRAYRIGQKKDVLVYRLMTCGTIEEKIYKMQVFKGGLFKTATEHKEQTRYFSQGDLRDIFRLPEEGFDVSVTQRQLDEEHDKHHIMSDSLKNHIEFLKSHNIAGVSHHSLLFSKTAPAPVLDEHEELPRRKESTFVGCSSSSSSIERDVNGAEFALKPKDVKTWKRSTMSVSLNKLTESEIRDKIVRLHHTLSNKAMISKLPDKGDRLKRQIADLNLELEKISVAESSEIEIIDLDDISEKFQRIHV